MKTLRYLDKKNITFLFFIAKSLFASNMFNHSFFKKTQTSTFQLQTREVLSLDILRISRTFPRLDKFEFFFDKNNNKNFSSFFQQQVLFFKNIFIFNLYHSMENFFLAQFAFVDSSTSDVFTQKNLNIFKPFL